MTIFLVLAFVVFILLVFAFRSSGSSRQEVIKPVRGDELAVWPFEPMPIMTPTEVIFFNRLQQAVPELIIFGQVQLSRIIMPNDDDDTDQGFWFNRICRMSVDYVLVDQDKPYYWQLNQTTGRTILAAVSSKTKKKTKRC